jgi:hypothetical protein
MLGGTETDSWSGRQHDQMSINSNFNFFHQQLKLYRHFFFLPF